MIDLMACAPASPTLCSPRWRGLFAVTLLGLLVSACGSGDSYTPQPVVAKPVLGDLPMVVNAESGAVMRKGDIWRYEWVNNTAGTGYYSTHYVSDLDPTSQLYTHLVFYSDGQPYQRQHFSSANALTRVSFGDTLCLYEPQTRSPFPRRPFLNGATWSYIWSQSCLTGAVATRVDKTFTGRVVSSSELLDQGLLGLASTTTTTGVIKQPVFDTVKYTATRTDTTTAGTWTYQDTCWHDKAQDRTVKCDTEASYVPTGSTVPSSVHSLAQRLAFVREVRTSPVLITDGPSTVDVYAGRWSLQLVDAGGVITITCPSVAVGLTGGVSGSCVRVVTPTTGPSVEFRYTVIGAIKRSVLTVVNTGAASTTRTVDAFTLIDSTNPSLLSVTGEMQSPLLAEGTWIGNATAGAGTWVAQRL